MRWLKAIEEDAYAQHVLARCSSSGSAVRALRRRSRPRAAITVQAASRRRGVWFRPCLLPLAVGARPQTKPRSYASRVPSVVPHRPKRCPPRRCSQDSRSRRSRRWWDSAGGFAARHPSTLATVAPCRGLLCLRLAMKPASLSKAGARKAKAEIRPGYLTATDQSGKDRRASSVKPA